MLQCTCAVQLCISEKACPLTPCSSPAPCLPCPSADLGGSVTAALAAASIVFRTQNDTDYAQRLLDKAQEVGSGPLTGRLGKSQGAEAGGKA